MNYFTCHQPGFTTVLENTEDLLFAILEPMYPYELYGYTLKRKISPELLNISYIITY
jgi:hypothetical protein